MPKKWYEFGFKRRYFKWTRRCVFYRSKSCLQIL